MLGKDCNGEGRVAPRKDRRMRMGVEGSVMRKRLWENWIFLVLAAAMLTGCERRTESFLRGAAKEFVTELGVDIEGEEHMYSSALANSELSSVIVSEYVVSNSPEEIRGKLQALHLAEDNWIAGGPDGWIGDVQLEVIEWKGRPPTPAEHKEKAEEFGMFRDLEEKIDFFIICPWHKFPGGYATIFSDEVILTTEGRLIITLYYRGQDRCHDTRQEE